jgi:hypothetical protein
MKKTLIILSCAATLLLTGCTGPALLPKEHIATISMPEENKRCLKCHDYILRGRPFKKGLKDLHRRHIESKRLDFNESQKYCTVCHEAWDEDAELESGIDREGVIHPLTAQQPLKYWRRNIQKTKPFQPEPLTFIDNKNPYLFKPMLQRLVCVDCHGPKSPIKEFYHPTERRGVP